MKMRLQELEICPHSDYCPFNDIYSKNRCLGTLPERKTKFECSLATREGKFRNIIEPKTN